jgi:hypothetical protein
MKTEATAVAPRASADPPPAPKRVARRLSGIRRGTIALWKFFAGPVLCQSLFGSLLVVGWTYRLAQRSALMYWWKRGRTRADAVDWPAFLSASHRTQDHLRWPNWIVQSNGRAAFSKTKELGLARRIRGVLGIATHSLRQNLRVGVQAIFNTWVLTLPACVMWLFAWYDGWNNSFNKGYEQAAVGPLTGLLGVALFIAAMFYVPLAQARQAVTGEWRACYQFRLVWSLIRRRWLASLGLAAAYSAVSLPVTILKTAPAFFTQINPALADATPARALQILNTYFFWACLVVFPAYVILRLVAARIYASAILDAVQRGAIAEAALAEIEWETLHQLDLLQVKPERPKNVLVKVVTWAGTRAGRLTARVAIALVWFSFVAQIFTSEFLSYHPRIGWLNQPLVQLPWFHYVPATLQPKR